MDELEGLFPIPLLRSRGVFDVAMVAALTDEIRSVFKQRNDRSDRLSHTEIVRPDAHPLYREAAGIAGEKIVEFGTLLSVTGCAGWSRRCGPTCSSQAAASRCTRTPTASSPGSST